MNHFLLGAVQVLLATQATVVGTVRDGESGGPLAGAVVTLVDFDRSTAADPEGRYEFRRVPPGPQRIAIRFLGYAPRSLTALVPRDGRLEINVSLYPQPLRLQTLEVRAPVVVRGIDGIATRAFPDRECSLAAVRNHPMLAEPDVLQALGGGEVVLSPETPSGIHIRGGATDQTAYLIDGIPVFSPFHAAGLSSAWNPDALVRLAISSSSTSQADPHTLSGAIEAFTRAPGDRLSAQGSFSTTQARVTLDGPLGNAGSGYVLSFRSGYPGIFAPRGEASYVKGETGDWLAKIEAPILGGKVRLLGYDSDNDIGASAGALSDTSAIQRTRRNAFEWHSRSLGAEWERDLSSTTLRIRGWSADGEASCAWSAPTARVDMTSARRDQGLLASVERGSSLAGIRLEQSHTSYGIRPDSTVAPSWEIGAHTPVATLFAESEAAIDPRLRLSLGASLAAGAGNLFPGSHAQLRWVPIERLALTGSYARTHQFAQSLRNGESVVGNVFPVDLYAGAGAPGVPVARSDQGVVGVEYRPSPQLHLGFQAYGRRSSGLLLVAPRDGQPFTTGGYAVGSGTSRGLAVDAAATTTRYGIVASYGLQRVRYEHDDSSYVPVHGVTHLLEGGVIVFPTATASIRLGATAALGRRTTIVTSGLEWESYNLLDQGSEFGGSPYYAGESLGGTSLPAYLRVDLGARKRWRVHVGGRDASIALFGTATNILGRKNVLTYSRDPSTGQLVEIEMRPRAPLVVGLDWRF